MADKKIYRRPTVAVIGAGAAGVAAAAECALIGFDTTLVDAHSTVGGRYAGATPEQPPKKFGFRKGNLKHTKFTGSAASAREHLAAAVEFSGARTKLGTTVTGAAFDNDTAQWVVATDAGEDIVADVVVVATGTGGIGEVADAKGRDFDLENAYLHQGIEPIGVPNMLVMDAPEPEEGGWFSYPLDIIEAKADHAQFWVRQLEVKGPGKYEVDITYWQAAQTSRRKMIADMRIHSPRSHTHTPLAATPARKEA